ncbi:hypothetical protein BCR35DRAFT_354630 [Leucosporidium creatinivorum]|uniref:N-acetyltransferase domain-containing protein n=1 Tax=Leucosporidium creatinivorum TaxID=106004 RepID=A0A1Y2ECG1_9BASI|nr:hypothetical protein BCR35DRAFT_354630 [Leucosporidium creatinivorum]
MSQLVDLVPFDPDNEVHVKELTRQRILCGWHTDMVETWRAKARKGDKGLRWIFRAKTPEALERFKEPLPEQEICSLSRELGPPSPDPDFRPIGHASLDWVDEIDGVKELELADRERGIITFSTFFMLVSQHGLGLGNAVMDELERLAGPPAFGAKFITLNTMDRDYATDPEVWKMLPGGYDPKRRINEDWYARRGYKAFRRAIPRYQETGVDGSSLLLNAVYMRKEVIAA